MNTCYGIALDQVGFARDGGRAWSTPSLALRSVQDPTIPIDLEHNGRQVGQVIYIERASGGAVTVVAEVNDDVTPHVRVRVGDELRHVQVPFYWSVERIGDESDGFMLRSIALTASPARVSARPVTFLTGTANEAAYRTADAHERKLLERAVESDRRRHAGPLRVCDTHADPFERSLDPALRAQFNEDYARPPGRMHYSTPYAGVLSVR